jgi:uncharacterized protein GlcG (DUF336 family)
MHSNRHLLVTSLVLCVVVACLVSSAAAQQPAPPPYGPAIDLATAQKMLAAAKAEADEQKWPVAIAIVDGGGYLVAFHRLDNTQLGSVEVAIQKAKTAALFRRPTKVFEELIAQGGGGLRILSLPGATPIEGGLPIVQDGKMIGAIGVSGVQSTQDAQVANAGLEALK